MTTSTTSIDIMGLQAAYATLHTDQERDDVMQRYHDVISSFGGKATYDADNRALLVMRSNLWFFSSRRRHTRFDCDWSSDVCSSDLPRCRPWSRVLARAAWVVIILRVGRSREG